MFSVRRLRLVDFHGRALLLLGEVEIRFVPFQAHVGVVIWIGGVPRLAARAGWAGTGRGAAVAGILEGVLEGDVFFGERVVQFGADLGGCWRWGGRNGGLAGGRSVVGVFEDSCEEGHKQDFGSCGGVIVYLWASWKKGWEGNESLLGLLKPCCCCSSMSLLVR